MRKGFIGFSWTTFFFGFFVPLFRGDWLRAVIMLLVSLPLVLLIGYVIAMAAVILVLGSASLGVVLGTLFDAVFRTDTTPGAVSGMASEAYSSILPLLAAAPFIALIPYWLVNLMFSFTYNKSYTRKLLAKGYHPADEESERLLIAAGLSSPGIIARSAGSPVLMKNQPIEP
jgi:hypothetical protein